MKVKKALVWRSAFFKLPKNLVESPITFFKFAHIKMNKKVVDQALMIYIATKAFNQDKINF